MRKTIFMLFSSFLVVALVAVIPAEIAAANPVSSPQPAEPVSAQQADIEALIEDILLELNQAKGMTTDSEIIDGIDGIGLVGVGVDHEIVDLAVLAVPGKAAKRAHLGAD